jgi:uncharacterized membrane protein
MPKATGDKSASPSSSRCDSRIDSDRWRRALQRDSPMNDQQDVRSAPHVPSEDTIQAIARLHSDHHASATWHQRIVYNLTSILCGPRFLVALTALLFCWMVANGLIWSLGRHAFDPPPYQGLSCLISIASLYCVVLVITTQRRDESLDRKRELLSLELAILSEQKMTKVIALLEELRRDIPAVQDRVDEQANAMARHADPHSVLEAIKEARSEAAGT